MRMYVFLDEAGSIAEFRKAVGGLHANRNCDVYIAVSSACMLFGELAAMFSGRHVEIRMLPLSFREYVSAFPRDASVELLFADHVQNGAFPYALEIARAKDRKQYLQGIYDSVVLREIVARRRFPDVGMLKSVLRFVLGYVGNACSTKGIADAMTLGGKAVSVHTVESHLCALTECLVLYQVGRYDVKGKRHLKTGGRHYAADVGLGNTLLGREQDFGHALENVVFLELLRHGYEVRVGKVGNREIDFIAFGDDGEEYYQVAISVIDTDGTALARGLAPLEVIHDHNPKCLLTMDHVPLTSHNGIRQANVIDWLLKRVD